MTCHQVIATDKPEIKKLAAYRARGEDIPGSAFLRIRAVRAREVQSRAAHSRGSGLRHVSRRYAHADGGRAESGPCDGFLRSVPSGAQCARGLRHLSLLIALSRGAAIEIRPASSAADCRSNTKKEPQVPEGRLNLSRGANSQDDWRPRLSRRKKSTGADSFIS